MYKYHLDIRPSGLNEYKIQKYDKYYVLSLHEAYEHDCTSTMYVVFIV